MIVEGRVNIFKQVEFCDANGKRTKRDELIMEIEGGDVIGEDAIWFERACQYTARAARNPVRTLSIDHQDFIRQLGRVIPDSRRFFQIRCSFMKMRYEQARHQIEYRCRKFNSKIS